MATYSLWVEGCPVQKGSITAFLPGWKPGQVTRPRVAMAPAGNTKNLKAWQKAVKVEALEKIDVPIAGAVDVRMDFWMPRPKSHYRQGKYADLIKKSAPEWHCSKPDVDKLQRAVLDGLTGAAFVDDSQVVSGGFGKFYSLKGHQGGVEITITELEEEHGEEE